VWLQHNAVVLVPQRPWTAGYPADTELLTTWLMAFTRTDALAGFTSLLPIPLAIAATTGLARSFGASARRAMLAGLLFGMTPALVALAGTTYVDAASVAFVAATFWLALRVIRGERDAACVLLLGLAAGLAIGAKGTNLVLVSPGLIAAGVVLLKDACDRARSGREIARTIVQFGLLALPILVLGVSWYAKNWLVYGNPVYPFAMGPFPGPTTLTEFTFTPPQLEGKNWIGQLVTSWTADWGLRRYPYNVRPGGLGAAWPAIIAIAVAGLVLLARRRAVAPIALVLIPAAVTLATMPMPWYARLTLFLPAVALPLAALAIDALRPLLATVAGLALVVAAAVSLTFANARPNIDIQAGNPPRLASVGQYVSFVLTGDDAQRADVSLRAECAGFGAISSGSVVAPGGFNLLHGVVGPSLDHILGEPLAAVTDPDALAAAVRARDADWIVTSSGGDLDAIAASAPDLFKSFGEICQGGRLYQLAR
jgi:4-amino-4-deoxy-L-arabinose transferase-like glycosyltransferase